MKKIVILSCLLSLLSCGVQAKPSAEKLDGMVAVVNDDVITQSELKHAISTAKLQIASQRIPTPNEQILKKQVLDQLIVKKLQLQMAKQAGVEISDAELNSAIQNVASQNQMSIDTFYQRLNQEGLSTNDYRSEMRDQMTMQRLQQQELSSKISISKQEVDAFTRSTAWKANNTKEYELNDILVPVSDTPSSEEIATAKTRADGVVAKLHGGQSFESVAQAESTSTTALQGGDLGWRKLSEIPTAFSEQVSRMNKNDIAGPIQTPNGFHILKLTDVRSAKTALPDRKTIEAQLLQQKFQEAVKNWVSKIRSQSYIVKNELA